MWVCGCDYSEATMPDPCVPPVCCLWGVVCAVTIPNAHVFLPFYGPIIWCDYYYVPYYMPTPHTPHTGSDDRHCLTLVEGWIASPGWRTMAQ